MLTITNVANVGDGVHATVTLDGTPGGAITFKASRTPVYADAAVVTQSGSHPTFTLALPHPVGWHVWVLEGGVPTTEPGAVWIATSDRQDLLEAGQYLADTLWANRRLLDAAMRQGGYSLPLQQAVFGFEGLVNKWPSIVVDQPRSRGGRIACPEVWQFTFTYRVLLLDQHTDEQPESPELTNVARAVQRIMNTPAYGSKTLPCGQPITSGQITDIDINEDEVNQAGFDVLAAMEWTCIAIIQDYTT